MIFNVYFICSHHIPRSDEIQPGTKAKQAKSVPGTAATESARIPESAGKTAAKTSAKKPDDCGSCKAEYGKVSG